MLPQTENCRVSFTSRYHSLHHYTPHCPPSFRRGTSAQKLDTIRFKLLGLRCQDRVCFVFLGCQESRKKDLAACSRLERNETNSRLRGMIRWHASLPSVRSPRGCLRYLSSGPTGRFGSWIRVRPRPETFWGDRICRDFTRVRFCMTGEGKGHRAAEVKTRPGSTAERWIQAICSRTGTCLTCKLRHAMKIHQRVRRKPHDKPPTIARKTLDKVLPWIITS